jgi:serine/threonine-protein kinase
MFEITVGEYMEFVNDPETLERINEALEARSPRLVPRDPSNPTGNTLEKNADGSFRARWDLRWPILSISFEDAAEYAAWRTRKALAAEEPFEYDLPDPDQWEKAARGADERIFPWGNVFDWSYCKGNWSKTPSAPEPVDTYPADESPYGVRNMAGGIREWNKGWLSSEGRLRPIRGGAWSSSLLAHFRAASWLGTDARYFETAYGFRLVARRRR